MNAVPPAEHFRPREDAPRRFAWAIEMAMMLSLILLADAVLQPSFKLMDATPHPFWAAVLAISLSYGTVRGLLCAFAASLVGHWHGWPPIEGADLYATMLHEWKEPVLWLAAALLAGRHQERRAEAAAALNERAAQAQEQRLAIAAYARSLRAYVAKLEQELTLSLTAEAAPASTRPVSLADLADALDGEDPRELETLLLQLSLQLTGSPVVALWLAGDDGWRRLWGAPELEALLPVAVASLRPQSNAITIPSSLSASPGQAEHWIAVPLRDPATGWLGGIALMGEADEKLRAGSALTAASALGAMLSEAVFAPATEPVEPDRSLLKLVEQNDAAR